MIAGLRPYPEYKDCGVEWLGQVPAHWEVRRIKRVARVNPSKCEVPACKRAGAAVFLPMERVGSDGSFDSSEKRCVSELWNGFTYFRRGDVLIAKITPCFENGKGACLDALPTEFGFGSTEFHVLRPTAHALGRYLHRVTTLAEFRKLGTDAMTGAAGQQRVPSSFIENFPMPLPPLPEQTAIVRFLDYVDRRVRRVIRARRRLVKLLEEYKQALIHQAVTGRIDVRTGQPYPEYKDSGVEWLGQVPAHWEVRRLKQMARLNPRKTEAKDLLEVDCRVTFLPMERVRVDGRIEATEHLPVSLVWNGFTYFRKGDVIVAKITPCFENGKGACLDDLPTSVGFGSTEFHVLRPRKLLSNRFLYRITTLADFRRLGTDAMIGAAGQQRVPESFVANFIAPLPSLPEQTAIVDYLDTRTAKIDRAIEAARREIKLVNEFRTRLIVDVVTGKLDVREVAARLPDPDPLAEDDSIEEVEPDEEQPAEELDEEPETDDDTIGENADSQALVEEVDA